MTAAWLDGFLHSVLVVRRAALATTRFESLPAVKQTYRPAAEI
jgi:hypothetical protein